MRPPSAKLALLLALTATVILPGAAQGIRANQILSFLRAQKESRGLNAVMCGVWQNGKPIVEVALGNSMTGVPATKAMHYRVGGVTYTCVGTLLLKFADLGKLSLKDLVSKWYPDLPNAKEVTLGMLASCTAGYPDYVPVPAFIDGVLKDPFRDYTSNDLKRTAFATPLLYAPGKGWNYSHTNFVILGDILEKVGKRPLGALLDRYIVKPLKLRDTYLPTTADIRPPVLHSFTFDRDVYEDCTFWNPSWAGRAGMMISNLSDLGVLARAIGTGQLLSRRSYKTQFSSSGFGLSPGQTDSYYGYGIVVLKDWYVQNPNIGGYTTIFAYLPAKNLSIVITSTKGPKSDPNIAPSQAMFIEMVKWLTPDHPLPASFK